MKPKKKCLLVVHSQTEWEKRLVKKPIRWLVAQCDPSIRSFNGTNFSRALGAVLTGVREKLRSGALSADETLEGHHTVVEQPTRNAANCTTTSADGSDSHD